VLAVEQGQTSLADNGGDSDETRVRSALQAAACIDRIAFGLDLGQTVPAVQGFSQHLPMRCGLDDCQALDRAIL
jgi:hypothetical protein